MTRIASRLKRGATWVAQSRLLRAAYEARAIGEAVRYWATPTRTLTGRLVHGDGRPIMVIPGFLCGDASTWALRRFLGHIGYTPLKWNQGINWGPQPGVRTRLLQRLRQIHDAYEEPATIIGWSLGGYYARELACIRPDLVREIVTLGSPLHGKPESAVVWRAFRWLNQRHMPQIKAGTVDFPQPQVPCLSIYTKDDGIVPWQYCVPRRGSVGQSVQVRGSHVGLVANPDVMRLLMTHLGSPRTSIDPVQRRQRRQERHAARRRRRSDSPSVGAILGPVMRREPLGDPVQPGAFREPVSGLQGRVARILKLWPADSNS